MRRTTWFVVGAAAGAVVVNRAKRASQALTYDGITDRLAGLFAGARVFGAEVVSAASEKETELRRRLGLGENGLSGPDAQVIPIDARRHQPQQALGQSRDDTRHTPTDEKGTS